MVSGFSFRVYVECLFFVLFCFYKRNSYKKIKDIINRRGLFVNFINVIL